MADKARAKEFNSQVNNSASVSDFEEAAAVGKIIEEENVSSSVSSITTTAESNAVAVASSASSSNELYASHVQRIAAAETKQPAHTTASVSFDNGAKTELSVEDIDEGHVNDNNFASHSTYSSNETRETNARQPQPQKINGNQQSLFTQTVSDDGSISNNLTNRLDVSPSLNEEEKVEEANENYTDPVSEASNETAVTDESTEQMGEVTNNDRRSLLLSNAVSYRDSYQIRLRRKMEEDRNQREAASQTANYATSNDSALNSCTITEPAAPNVLPLPALNEEGRHEETQQSGVYSPLTLAETVVPGVDASNVEATSDGSSPLEMPPDEATPGAFAITERAIGSLPVWARLGIPMRRSPQEETELSRSTETRGCALEAVVIDESELEQQIRLQITRESVMADSVKRVQSPQERRKRNVAMAIIAIAALTVIIGLSIRALNRENNDTSSTAKPLDPTLQLIQKAGKLRCYSYHSADKEFCKAVSAAVFGKPGFEDITTLHSVPRGDVFASLANATFHLMPSTVHTMARDIYQESSKVGFAFSTPYHYDGLTFGGSPEFVKCADELNTFDGCSKLKICVVKDTTFFKFLDMRLPASAVVPIPADNILGMYKGLSQNICNVIASIGQIVAKSTVQQFIPEYLGEYPYEVGKKIHTKDPLAVVTRDGDPEWRDFVNAVIQSLFAAETMNITQNTADRFGTTTLFGSEYENMFVDAISTVGNFGEIFARQFGDLVPRTHINRINTNGSTGLIYSLPFGEIEVDGPGPMQGGTLETILRRGKLLCGVQPNRPGFAYYNVSKHIYSGLDADYCHALASGIFRSNRSAVDIVPYDEKNIFLALANGTLDVAAGIGITLERDVREPTTLEGFSFSVPYFYDPPKGQLNTTSSLVTRQDDSQWSAIVQWVVMATFYAEENNFTHDSSYEMPLVKILGPTQASNNVSDRTFNRMLRDAILVGNYGELYERNVERFIPRSGRNNLNVDPLGPQLNPSLLF